MNEIFISYKRTDEQAAMQLVRTIESQFGQGTCWIDTNGIESGEYFRDTIMRAITNARVVLFLMSKTSVISQSSAPTWIQKEVLYALRKGIRVIPVSIDGTSLYNCDWLLFECGELDFIDWNIPKQREKLIGNLRNWFGGNNPLPPQPAPSPIQDNTPQYQPEPPRHYAPVMVETQPLPLKATSRRNLVGLIISLVISGISTLAMFIGLILEGEAPELSDIFIFTFFLMVIALIVGMINPKLLAFSKRPFVFIYLYPMLMFLMAGGACAEDDYDYYYDDYSTEVVEEVVEDSY
ncbi:MAG: toll/interleukin-1 receptor domain-containing protein [Clostridiales bacterium]|nr:toll/interleukin-1 receptor domain-containing protein [Clostridiales bacterium]